MICDMFALSLSSCGMCMLGISLDNSLEKYGNKTKKQIIIIISSYAINNYNSLTSDMGYARIGVGLEKLDKLLYYNIFYCKRRNLVCLLYDMFELGISWNYSHKKIN